MTPRSMARPTGDLAAALSLLRQRFPEVPIWFGLYTGHCWALSGGRLVEADTAAELGRLLDSANAQQLRGPVNHGGARPLSPGWGPYGPPMMRTARTANTGGNPPQGRWAVETDRLVGIRRFG